jgi:hypothetical protein
MCEYRVSAKAGEVLTVDWEEVAAFGCHLRRQSLIVVGGFEEREGAQVWRQVVRAAVVTDADGTLEAN